MDRTWRAGDEYSGFLVIEVQGIKILNAGRRSDEELFCFDELFAAVFALHDQEHSVVFVAFCCVDGGTQEHVVFYSFKRLLVDFGV